MGNKVTEVSAGVAANLVDFEDENLEETAAEHDGDSVLPGLGMGGASDEPEEGGSTRRHDNAAILSDTGMTVFNYSERDRMSGDGGESNSIGFRNFAPVATEDLDIAEQRRKEADEQLMLVLEQYEAAQRLADIEARIAALEKEIKDLTTKIEAFDQAFELGNDTDINDDTLNGLAKRNRMRSALLRAGLDPDEYFKADGSFDQEKWQRDLERNREIQQSLEDRRRAASDEAVRLGREHEQLLRNNPGLNDLVERRDAGDPEAKAELDRMGATRAGLVDVSYTVLNSTAGLDTEAKAKALEGSGPEGQKIESDGALVIAQLMDADTGTAETRLASDADLWGDLSTLDGVGSALPPPAPVQTASTLPETVKELLSPLDAVLPAGTDLPVPDIKLIDTIPTGLSASAQDFSGERSVRSVAAELGVESVAGDIKPISGMFAQAVNGELAATQVAALEAESGLTAEDRRTPAVSTVGAPGGGGAFA